MLEDLDDVLAAFVDDEDNEEDDKPRLFCDSTFALGESPASLLTGAILTIHGTEREWDDAALEEGTGNEYPLELVNGSLVEKKIEQAQAEWYNDIFKERKEDIEKEEDEAKREALPPPWCTYDPFENNHMNSETILTPGHRPILGGPLEDVSLRCEGGLLLCARQHGRY